ncbi:hypothetical protein [Streptomyces griseus]|uniref:hypothetical protein n=1 Tax=Streptomyces griseus TaxID=1911 RepID=UPI0036574BFE
MKKMFSMAAGVAIAVGSIAMAAPAAQAGQVAPAALDCNTGKSSGAPYRGYATCTGMPSGMHVQVVVTCVDPRGSQWKVNGPFVKNSIVSFAKCSDNPSVGIASVSYRLRT